MGETLAQWTKYTLAVDVGDRKEAGLNIVSYKVQLWAGGTMLVEDNNSLSPADDQFLTSTIMFSVFAFHAELGSSLEIKLLSGGSQVNFDDVKLTAVPFTTLFVDDDGTFDNAGQDCDGSDAAHTSVQDAIDAASENDVIKVCPGTYTEDLDIATNGLTLMGVGECDAIDAIIKGSANDTDTQLGVASGVTGFPRATPNIDIRVDGVTLTDLTIQSPPVNNPSGTLPSGTGEYTSGIILTGTDITIEDNCFKVSTGLPGSVAIQTWDGAVLDGLQDISGLTITGNLFESSAIDTDTTDGFGYEGIFINPQDDTIDTGKPVTITNNAFHDNLYRAVGVARSFTNVLSNTMCTELAGPQATVDFGGSVPWGVRVFGVSDVWVDENIIGKNCTESGNFGIAIDFSFGTTDSAAKRNDINFAGIGVHLDETSGGNTVNNNSIGHSQTDGILIESNGNDVFRNTTHHSGDDGIEVTGTGNTFEGNNSHHNSASAYNNDGGVTNCFDDAGKDRNKAKFNADNNIPENGDGAASSC